MFLKDVSEQLLLKDDFDPAVHKDVSKNNVPTPDDFEEGASSGVFEKVFRVSGWFQR